MSFYYAKSPGARGARVMWIHAPKANHQMCQTVADALFLPENKWDIVRKTNVQTIVCREIGNTIKKNEH